MKQKTVRIRASRLVRIVEATTEIGSTYSKFSSRSCLQWIVEVSAPKNEVVRNVVDFKKWYPTCMALRVVLSLLPLGD